jgi:hypothetical protein
MHARPRSGNFRPVHEDQARLREALKLVAVALKESGLPFALTGGYALWARGAPEPLHDVDFMIAEEDVAEVATRLAEEGFDVVQPPEDWLFKVYTGAPDAPDSAMVDIIFRDAGQPATREAVQEADEFEVLSVQMPVLSATELMVHKLAALDEHWCDFGWLLPVARALREQVDWDRVRRETSDNDFAVAFLFLAERLRIAPEGGSVAP